MHNPRTVGNNKKSYFPAAKKTDLKDSTSWQKSNEWPKRP